MISAEPQTLTPRESLLMQHETEENEKARTFEVEMKKLDLEFQKLEARWKSWLRIPMAIVKLPVGIVLAVGYVIAVARGKDVSQNFWDFLK